ncbi:MULTISPECIES: rhodanese-like domain-containing protein [unclassified Streptomyces]|uniref:rhodanese-like domain-containing protein n=1 Tax=unclassified Streptomyces TaxID=2593676 RepID=UPI000F44DD5D|nr:rhodanese-like domain-containing protein [Streptomyces sp. I6]RNL70121.1 rhodanese-like domain-containing protein [Streptomyces sp. I6]
MSLFRRHQPRVTVDAALRQTSGDRPDAVLLDVREQPEWDDGHAPDAVHLPLSRLLAGGALPPGAAGRTLLVICRSGRRSEEAVKLLAGRGARAVDVEGGMIAWAAAGHPVVGERGNGDRTK